MDSALEARLAGIERRLDAQLVWQAGVMPILLTLLEQHHSPRDLQIRIVQLIEQADALALWAMLPASDRARAREYAEQLRSWPEQQTRAARPETGLPGWQSSPG